MAEQIQLDPSIHPLLAARPPVMDELTYLTFVECILTRDSVPVLEQILEDDAAQPTPELLIGIGWDLIAILLPLLPESKRCLELVARAGNPRECVVKAGMAVAAQDWNAGVDDVGASTDTGKQEKAQLLPVQQFTTLMSMLETCHSRIRTKRPSLFIQTTLKAVLSALPRAPPACLLAVLPAVNSLILSMRPRKKPPRLPPRGVSSDAAGTQASPARPRAPDPEADTNVPVAEDAAITERILQAALTFAAHGVTRALEAGSPAEIPGLGWSFYAVGRMQPAARVPRKEEWSEHFRTAPDLLARQTGMSSLVEAAAAVGLSGEGLLKGAMPASDEGDRLEEDQDWMWDEDHAPRSVEDVALNSVGCLHLFCTWLSFTRVMGEGPEQLADTGLTIFPTIQTLFDHHLPNDKVIDVDALLALPLMCLEHDAVGDLPGNTHFMAYLQTCSALAATATNPALRKAAHFLTSTLLRSHPEPGIRLAFIKEAMGPAPFENLKPVAVGWLKGEIVEANADAFRAGPLAHAQNRHDQSQQGDESEDRGLFATPLPLHMLSSTLFPDLSADVLVANAPLAQSWGTFRVRVGFYAAVLNFYYLLLSGPKAVRERLDVGGLHRDGDIGGAFLGRLREAVGDFRVGLGEGEGRDKGVLKELEDGEGVDAALAELQVVEHALDLVEGAVKTLGSEL